jgi:hypothetical protein
MPQKNLIKLPPTIKSRLKQLAGKPIIAACSRVYSAEDLEAGGLKHLGVRLNKGTLTFPQSLIPPATSGKYSFRNVEGEEVVRRDLPMETHHNAVESPNWGDSYNGTHTVYLPYQKYARDFIGPRLSEMRISSPNTIAGQAKYMLIFEIDRVLEAKAKDFEKSLLECLNLLQENVGHCGVQSTGATIADYVGVLKVSWDVLPPGTKEEAIARLFKGQTPSQAKKDDAGERYDFLMSLKPSKLVYGTSGLQRYFGGLIKDDLVVFENIEYGNAIYVMFDNWKALSQRTRTELLSGRFGANFERIMHTSGWKTAVRTIIKLRTAPNDKQAKRHS